MPTPCGTAWNVTIEIKEGRYFLGLWFVSGSNTRDWLCAAYHDEGSDEWNVRYRFRYYKDDKNDDSADDKSWYHCTMSFKDTSEEKLLSTMDTMANALVATGYGPCMHRDIVRSSDPKVCMRFFEQNPDWAHLQKVSAEEAEKKIAEVRELNENRVKVEKP